MSGRFAWARWGRWYQAIFLTSIVAADCNLTEQKATAGNSWSVKACSNMPDTPTSGTHFAFKLECWVCCFSSCCLLWWALADQKWKWYGTLYYVTVGPVGRFAVSSLACYRSNLRCLVEGGSKQKGTWWLHIGSITFSILISSCVQDVPADIKMHWGCSALSKVHSFLSNEIICF
jgi:hypothetical protein